MPYHGYKILGIVTPSDTARNEIGQYLQLCGYINLCFNAPVRDAVHHMIGGDTGLKVYSNPHQIIEGYNHTPKELCDMIYNAGRSKHPDFWLQIARIRMDEIIQKLGGPELKGFAFMDAVRTTEIAWIRSEAGKIWHVDRRIEDLPERIPGDAWFGTPSSLASVKALLG